jgi:hypothetical protein
MEESGSDGNVVDGLRRFRGDLREIPVDFALTARRRRIGYVSQQPVSRSCGRARARLTFLTTTWAERPNFGDWLSLVTAVFGVRTQLVVGFGNFVKASVLFAASAGGDLGGSPANARCSTNAQVDQNDRRGEELHRPLSVPHRLQSIKEPPTTLIHLSSARARPDLQMDSQMKLY